MRKPILATRVSPVVNKSVRLLTKGLGITISEYMRRLIMQDLDSRNFFNEELKKALQSHDDGQPIIVEERRETSANKIRGILLGSN